MSSNPYLFVIDCLIHKIVFTKDNIERVYLENTENIVYELRKYNLEDKRDWYMDGIGDCDFVKPYIQELKNQPLIKEYVAQLDDSDKLYLFKRTCNLTRDDDDDKVNWDTIRNYFFEDDWEAIVSCYMYLRAYELVSDEFSCSIEDCQYPKLRSVVFNMLKEIDYTYRILDGAKKIAIKKIMRNEIYYCGLAKKLSMCDCGIKLVEVN